MMFSGRMNRLTFFVSWLQITVLSVILIVIIEIFLTDPLSTLLGYGISILFGFFNAVIVVRRFHDLGMSGWYFLLFCIPLVNFITLLALFFVSGQAKSNKYGALSKRGVSTFLKITSEKPRTHKKKSRSRR